MSAAFHSLAYVVCVLSGTPMNLQYTHCFPDVLQTSHAMRRDECETVLAEITTKPHILDGHEPRRGFIKLGIVKHARCIPLQDA